jgi:hypothetical protein
MTGTPTITATATVTQTPTLTATKVITSLFGAEADIDPVLGGELNAQNGAFVVRFPASAISRAQRVRFEAPTKDVDKDSKYRPQVLYRFSLRALDLADLKTETKQFSKPVTVTVRYDPKALPGWREQDLLMVYWDTTKKEWARLPSRVDAKEHTVTTQTTHFTDFGLVDGPDIMAYLPNLQSAEPSLFTGAATNGYAIEVPPGRGGLAPKVDLSYSSAGADMMDEYQQGSFVGTGWSLSSSYIARDTRSTYDSTDDVFSLVMNGGGYDLEQDAVITTTYHTASEQYWRIYVRSY